MARARVSVSRGWTLVELVITVGLTGLLAVPLGTFFAELVRGSLEDQEQALVLNLARMQLEEVNSLPYGSVVTIPTLSSYQAFPYDVTRQVATQSPTDGSSAAAMKRVTVRVFPGGADQAATPPLVTVITYRANGVTSGT